MSFKSRRNRNRIPRAEWETRKETKKEKRESERQWLVGFGSLLPSPFCFFTLHFFLFFLLSPHKPNPSPHSTLTPPPGQ